LIFEILNNNNNNNNDNNNDIMILWISLSFIWRYCIISLNFIFFKDIPRIQFENLSLAIKKKKKEKETDKKTIN